MASLNAKKLLASGEVPKSPRQPSRQARLTVTKLPA
jgi:hypothetical protein